MRTAALAGCLALLAACTPAPEQAEAPPPAPPAAPPATLADFAGTWNTTTTLTGVTAPVESQLVGSADGSTWTLVFPGRDPVPLQASVVGDSLIATGDPRKCVRHGAFPLRRLDVPVRFMCQ